MHKARSDDTPGLALLSTPDMLPASVALFSLCRDLYINIATGDMHLMIVREPLINGQGFNIAIAKLDKNRRRSGNMKPEQRCLCHIQDLYIGH